MLEINYGCRWEEAVQTAIEMLGGGEGVLHISYEANWQGHMDIDVLLTDGRVFSYYYSYGSCSGCDPWEGTEFDSSEEHDNGLPLLAKHILDEATIFSCREVYDKWAKMRPKGGY